MSTDGGFNVGVDPAGDAGTTGTAAWAVANDADVVNALGIGTATAPNFNSGTDSFSLLAQDFDDFEQVLTDKLERETGVPTPATFLLMGIGLLAFGFASRARGGLAA